MKARGTLPRAFIGFLEPRRSTPMIDNQNDAFAQYEAQARLRAELAREVTPLNKAALFAVLQAAGVQCVTVHVDGAGDPGHRASGQNHAFRQPQPAFRARIQARRQCSHQLRESPVMQPLRQFGTRARRPRRSTPSLRRTHGPEVRSRMARRFVSPKDANIPRPLRRRHAASQGGAACYSGPCCDFRTQPIAMCPG